MDEVKRAFDELLAEKNIVLNEKQWNQFEAYYHELVSWNEKMNLTGITEREQVYIKHFYDSLSLSFFVPMSGVASIADIGSGAGFPSIPLKIVYPHLRVTVIDSLNKRIQFLNHLVETLELDHVQCIHGRAEDLARKSELRDSFDLVTARAVARMNVLNEFCLPFVKPSGLFAAMKGSDPEEELREAEFSLKQLRGEKKSTFRFELPIEQSTRHIIVIKKTNATPAKYPRKAGLPLKQPLA
ncbi:16S rRNA (guanine(527)-N(7))-methyltransferase RsmG [Paenibacillus hemerocallicola]|uniref:Ribosomal RNA small subunit methyltransferase G n=1 Tax=Paenibacillus hemerocallicola TaxID=1172614 RepID=A0A5C4SZY1_9BACL|nr:16S rRNA (guanine(527)-N(7))-methyltransferase RsmG [Paenibacillus hemerocallicola]TNJ62075.1 16S rRNA (guanine(527)-N(7))-methyltransferase RsmG [Paenibacillus hemerocallicola]